MNYKNGMTRQELLDANPDLQQAIKTKYNIKVWIRTCQECGNKQSTFEPKTDKQLYDLKCLKCGSTECFDYGSSRLQFPFNEEEQNFLNKLDELDTEPI